MVNTYTRRSLIYFPVTTRSLRWWLEAFKTNSKSIKGMYRIKNDSYPGGGPAKPGGGGKGIPGGKPGGRKPGGGPGIPGGAKGMGGRANEGGPTISGELSDHQVSKTLKKILLGGIIPIPRPAGIPRPGPTGSYNQKSSEFFSKCL